MIQPGGAGICSFDRNTHNVVLGNGLLGGGLCSPIAFSSKMNTATI